MSDDLNFGSFDSGEDPFGGFDGASGATVVTPGWHLCRLERGETTVTRAGKTAYRVRFAVLEGDFAGFKLWRYFTFGDPAAVNRAKDALKPLGLTTKAHLLTAIPAPGRVITCKVLAAVQARPDGTPSNDVVRFEVVSAEAEPPSRFAAGLGGPDGGTP